MSRIFSFAFALLCTGCLMTVPVQAEEHGSKPAKSPEVSAKKEPHDAMPEGTKGVADGKIVAKEASKLTVMTKEGTFLFAPHWRGGQPKDGGGLDKDVVAQLEKFSVGDYVHITWTWGERRRIESISKIAK